MALTITDTEITSDRTIIRARYLQHAAADGSGAWIVNGRGGRLFTRDQAIAEMTAAEKHAAGHLAHADPMDDGLEPYCLTCGSWVGIFQGHGDGWHHFHGQGTPDNPVVLTDADHEAVVAWREPQGQP